MGNYRLVSDSGSNKGKEHAKTATTAVLMINNRNSLFLVLTIACFAGYLWLFSGRADHIIDTNSGSVCIIKQTLHIPCPSCGSTRSVISIMQGKLGEAVKINPLGFLVAAIMFLSPLWMLFDLLTKRKTLFEFYLRIENYLKRPKYAIPMTLLVVINWIWNIAKDL